MKIYHYDEAGELVGEGVADADPLDHGAWLMPANSTKVEPPKHIDGSRRVFVASGWEYRDIPAAPIEEAAPIFTAAEEAAPIVTAAELRKTEILIELQRIDSISTRPARAVAYAIANGNQADPVDVAQLGALEAQAQSLRAELKALA